MVERLIAVVEIGKRCIPLPGKLRTLFCALQFTSCFAKLTLMARKTHHTSLAATFAVGAELSRRGYDVAFTIGNTVRIDLICGVPDGEEFKVQVKGISNPAGFYVQKSFFEAPPQDTLFLIVVLVPKPGDNSAMRFFILSHKEAIIESDKMPKSTRDGRPIGQHDDGLYWGSITPYENNWNKLPSLR